MSERKLMRSAIRLSGRSVCLLIRDAVTPLTLLTLLSGAWEGGGGLSVEKKVERGLEKDAA